MKFKEYFQQLNRIVTVLVSGLFLFAARAATYRTEIKVIDGATGEPVEFAAVRIGAATAGLTDADGIYTADSVDGGKSTIQVSSVGFKPYIRIFNIDRNLKLTVALAGHDNMLREVVVTAREAHNASSASIIDTMAMRHLQPSSFTDLLSLLPGGITRDPDMGTVNSVNLRQAVNVGGDNDDYATSALGTSFIIDGVRLNTDAEMQLTPDADRSGRITTGKGVDMRRLSTDEIESVEIVRGIPSVEYGELTSGLVNIKRKNNARRFEARFKADTQSQLFYVGKGFSIPGVKNWIVNAGMDYFDSKIDPRNNRDSFKRVNGSLRSDKRWTGPSAGITWNSAFSYSGTFEKDDNDPDLTVNNTIDFYKNTRHSFRWDNTLSYTPGGQSVVRGLNLIAGLSYASENLQQNKHVAPTRIMPLPVSLTAGSNYVGYLPMLYLADYRVEGRPFTAQVKGNARLLFNGNFITETLKGGLEWNMSKNYGKGAVYDISRPLNAGNTTRPRAFSDIPAMHQLSAYVESETILRAGRGTFTLTAGLRETQLLHLDSRYELSGKPYLDPRFNLVWNSPAGYPGAHRLDLEFAAGAGWHTKMPVAAYLYPDKYYTDIEQLNYYPADERYRTMNVMTFIDDLTNYGLRAARNFKWEVRADISYRDNRLSVTYFRENLNNGFRQTPEVFRYTYNRYDATDYDPSATGHAPTIGELPYTTLSYLATRNKVTNGSSTRKEGIEYTFRTRRFKGIHTRLTVNGAYFRTVNRNSQALWYKPSVMVNNKELQYVGLYDDNDGMDYRSFNTNFLFDTDIQRLNLNFSVGIQNVWFTRRRVLWRDGRPEYYMDIDMNVHPYTDESARDPYLTQLIRPYTETNFVWLDIPVSTTVNLKATKSFWKNRVGIAVYVNRLISIEPDYKRYGLTIRRYSSPYFGMELNLKL